MNAANALAAYRNTGSEKGFSELVRQYSNLVYSVARRRVNDGSLAEDVTQTVFSRLAKAPPAIRTDGELVAWLHRTTTHVAIDAYRAETGRRVREQHAAFMQSLQKNDSRIWDEMSPYLDEALDGLSDPDRQAVLLRFFERKPMRDVGHALGVSEDAAKMRISRAIERLRRELSTRGVACTVLVLAPALTARAVEAAPPQLLVRLSVIKRLAPVGGGIAALMFQWTGSKVAMGTIAAALTLSLLIALSPGNSPEEDISPSTASSPVEDPGEELSSERRFTSGRVPETSLAVEPYWNTRFILRVIDRETGRGLFGAQVRAVYFYAGGVGERHNLRSDAYGNVFVPYQNDPVREAGMNVFVAIPGYVPKAVNLHNRRPLKGPWEDLVMELESAVTATGVVVNEDGWPVEGVTLQARRFEDHKRGEPTTDFQMTKVITDATGRYQFPYVPKNYETIEFSLTCDGYAVTQVTIPIGPQGSANTVMVIERGFSVVGRVEDDEGRPMVGAKVQEKHEYGHRKLSTVTDENGLFGLHGLGVPSGIEMTLHFPDHLNPGERLDPASLPKERSLSRVEQVVDVTVEAEGMAAQFQTVQLSLRTNVVNFVLAPSRVFRGRVMDEFGSPVPKAVVRTDSHFDPYVPNRFHWLTHTDANGRFEWRSAPQEETCFWFEADGYEVIRGRPMLPDGTDHQIILTRRSEIHGR